MHTSDVILTVLKPKFLIGKQTMNTGDFVYEEVDQIIIKEEEANDYEDFEHDQNRWESAPNYVEFETDSVKCGEVMVARGGGLTLVCSLCVQPFSDLVAFGSHIQTLHMKTQPDSETENEDNSFQAEVKSETLESPEENVVSFVSSDGLAASTESSKHDSLSKSFMKQSHSSNSAVSDQPIEIEMPVASGEMNLDASANTELKTCKYCDQQFISLWSFKAHVLSHKGPKRYVCPYCPKTFVSTASRSSHVNTHTGERPHKCPHCPKGFAHRTNLEMHVRTHLKICKFSCSYCDKRFVQSSSHKIHERMHTGEKPYQCEECGKRFVSQKKLTIHSRTHAKVKDHKCEVCGKAFHSAERIKEHMRKHSDERPFHCNICGQTFPRRMSLRAHKELHSGVKKYVCTLCGKAFAQYAGLYSHKKSHIGKPAQ